MCYAIHTINKICSQQAVLTLYFANVQSIIKYGIIFWGIAPKWEKVFKIQKRIIRIITNKTKLSHCKQLFINLNILTFPSLYIYHTILYTVQNIKLKQNSNIHSYNTKNHNKIHIIPHRTAKFASGPYYKGIQLINKLPKAVREYNDIKIFKKQLKLYLIEKAFYSVEEYLQS